MNAPKINRKTPKNKEGNFEQLSIGIFQLMVLLELAFFEYFGASYPLFPSHLLAAAGTGRARALFSSCSVGPPAGRRQFRHFRQSHSAYSDGGKIRARATQSKPLEHTYIHTPPVLLLTKTLWTVKILKVNQVICAFFPFFFEIISWSSTYCSNINYQSLLLSTDII